MAPVKKKIVIASRDEDLGGLAKSLEQNGFSVVVCSDGARALEQALTGAPALMVVDTEIAIIPAQKLFHILRANPRTEKTAFFFVGPEGHDIEGFRRHRDFFVARPYNPEQLLSGIGGYISRQEKAEEVGEQDTDIEGKLQQVSLVDLLQIFSVNRKNGVLHLSRDGLKGQIHIYGGAVVNARVGSVEGEKAFFRMLTWEEGQFWFTPGGVEDRRVINAPTEHLIMEGLRQSDELAAQSDHLPDSNSSLKLNVSTERLPRGLRPATQELLLTLQYYHRVQDILDHCSQTDFEVFQLLRVLMEKGVVSEEKTVARKKALEPLLSSADILAIKDRLGEREVLLEEASVKMILLADSPDQVKFFVRKLTNIPEFQPEPGVTGRKKQLILGDIGRLTVGDMFSLRVFCIPGGLTLSPLWAPFRRRLLGVVALSSSPEVRQAEEYFQSTGNVPVVRVNCDNAEDETFPAEEGDYPSLKRLLGFFAAFYTGKLLAEDEE